MIPRVPNQAPDRLRGTGVVYTTLEGTNLPTFDPVELENGHTPRVSHCEGSSEQHHLRGSLKDYDLSLRSGIGLHIAELRPVFFVFNVFGSSGGGRCGHSRACVGVGRIGRGDASPRRHYFSLPRDTLRGTTGR